jgi:hypothetical protein
MTRTIIITGIGIGLAAWGFVWFMDKLNKAGDCISFIEDDRP